MNTLPFHLRKRGSVLGASMIIALVLAVVLAGLVGWVNTESKVTRGHVLSTHARLAAEGTASYGVAEIRSDLSARPYFASNFFTSANNPPALPPASLLGATLVDVGNLVSQTFSLLSGNENSPDTSTTTPTGIQIVPERINAGPASAWQTITIDGSLPLYETDPLRGMRASVTEISVVAKARATDTASGRAGTAYVERRLQVRDVPLFAYMTFYNMDLEISPAGSMDLYGPVHTNGSLYTQTYDQLTYHGIVTAAGGIYHGRRPGVSLGVGNDPVYFKGVSGFPVNMKQGSTWVQSSLADWAERADQLWGDNVRDAAHGITASLPPGIPEYTPDDPATPLVNERVNSARVFILPSVPTSSGGYPGDNIEVQKFAARASLLIEVTTTTTPSLSVTTRIYKYVPDATGTYLHVTNLATAPSKREELAVPAGLITARSFYDRRRVRTMASADLDVGVLKSLIEVSGSGNSPQFSNGSVHFKPESEWNGVVYVDQSNATYGALRVVNAVDVPNRPTGANGYTKGFTLATNGPLYINGHYNADGNLPSNDSDIVNPDDASEPPCALVADAITILSSSWDDADSSLGIGTRQAGPTEISAAVITGIVPSTNSTYSGGSHNLLRMLEDWRNVKQGMRTSQVVLFESEVAYEPWPGQSPVYEPPTRVFGFHKLFEQGIMPPGTPNSRSFRVVGGRELNATEYAARLAEWGEN